MAEDRIRYVWGNWLPGRGRVREVWAMDGVVRCALYTAYFGSPEAHTVKLYPKRLLVRGSIRSFDKKTVALRDIDDK